MSAVFLPDKHFFLVSSKEMHLISAQLARQYQVHIFVYTRYYKDGSCIILSNNDCWLQYHLSKGYLVPAPVPLELLQQDESFHIIPNDGLFSEAKHDLFQRYHSGQAVDYIVKNKHYVEVVCFAFASDNKNALNTIVNNLHGFKEFVSFFKDKMASLINYAELNKISLPTGMSGIPLSYLQDNFSDAKQSTEINKNSLSQRQLDVLYWVGKAKTAKEISTKLGLSHRTVESYLATLKMKMNASSKSELAEKSMILFNAH